MKAGVLENFKDWRYEENYPDPVINEENILQYSKQATGEKYLITPS